MDTAILVLLGVIALASAAQTVALVGLGRGIVRGAGRLADIDEQIVGRLRPTVQELARASQHLADSSGVLARESRQLQTIMEQTVEHVERAQQALEDALLPSANRMASVMAAVRLVRSGLRIYRRFKP